jgi:flagellar biosynthesis protein FlhG
MRRRAGRGVTLAITSGKGGVGKSNVAVNLSICLAANGLRVTLVDVDMGLANIDLLLNMHPPHTLAHVLSGLRSLEAVCVDGPGGIRFVPGASGRNDLANLTDFDRQNLITQLGKLHRSADMVVLDCGAGISSNVMSFAQAADAVLVITTPQPTAVTDAYATIKVLHREKFAGEVSLFVNMANSRTEASATYQRVAGVSKRFLNYLVADGGYMLHDTAVEMAVQERSPFVISYPRANASAAIAALACRMSQTHVERPGRGGLLRRVAGLFV